MKTMPMIVVATLLLAVHCQLLSDTVSDSLTVANAETAIEVQSWSETRVVSRINPIIGDIPLRPHYGKTWLQTGADLTSNIWPIMYKPIYGTYVAGWSKILTGGLFGSSKTDVFLENRMLGDADFSVDATYTLYFL